LPFGLYGVLLVLGIASGAAVVRRLAPRVGIERSASIDLVFWTVLCGMIGARVLYVAVEWEYYRDLCVAPELRLPVGIACTSDAQCLPGQACDGAWCRIVGDCFAALKVWQGGWVFLGGLLGGVPAALLFMRMARIQYLAGLALLSVAMPLGHAFGRVGCFFHGCCHGRATASILAVGGMFPVQLVEAAGNVAIFATVLGAFLRATAQPRRGPPTGHVGRASPAEGEGTVRKDVPSPLEGEGCVGEALAGIPALYVALYAVLRLVTELFRGDPLRGFLVEVPWPAFSRAFGFPESEPVFISTSQAISIGLLVTLGMIWGRGKARGR